MRTLFPPLIRMALLGAGLIGSAGTAHAQFVTNGAREAAFGNPLAVQNAPTGFGDNTLTSQILANGSELDAVYARVVGSNLHLFLSGNLETNGNGLDLFFDTKTGGQNILGSANPDVDGDGLNAMAGLTFDAGFAADYYLTLKLDAAGVATASYATLNNPINTGLQLGTGAGTSLPLIFGPGISGELAVDNSNAGGVTGAASTDAGTVLTGMEFVLPLAALGSPVADFRLTAFINGGGHNYLSNQVLGSLGMMTGNLEAPSGVNFNQFGGTQSVLIPVSATPPARALLGLSDDGLDLGSAVVGNTGTTTLTLRNRGTGAALVLSGATYSNPAFSGAVTGSVAAGAEQTFSIVFTPTAAGLQTGTLTFQTTDPNQQTVVLPLTALGSAATGPAVDGNLDASYPAALALQTTPTGFGDNESELNGAYARIENNTLYLLLTGNLQANGNPLELFFDTQTGGQNVLPAANPTVDGNALTTMAGLTFDAGFAPDYYLTLRQNGSGGGNLLTAGFTALTGAAGTGTVLATGANSAAAVLDFGGGSTGQASINNTNTGGVTATTVGTPGDVTTGIELAIPLAALGSPVGDFRLSALINGGGHNFLSNQVLAGLPLNTPNLGDPTLVNFTTLAGDQFLTIPNAVAAPAISATPNPLVIGAVVVGATGTGTLTVSNTGTAPLIISGITSSGAVFTVAPATATVAPGASATFTVTFAPTAVGAQTANLSIASNAVGSPLVVAVSGTATAAPVPVGSLSVSALTFGNVNTGSTSTAVVRVRNRGTAPLDIASITSSNALFTAAPTTGTVAPGDSLTVTVSFAPTAAGAQTGTLTVTTNSSTNPVQTVSLSGTGVIQAPVGSLSVTALSFGNVNTGSTGTAVVRVRNRGTAPLDIASITSSNALFTAAPTTGTVAPGDSLTVTVSFAPTAAGAQTGTLTVTTNSSTNPVLTVALTGTGVVPAVITVDGALDAGYGAALALQTTPTGFGDATGGTQASTGGSELDGAYARIENNTLYLLLTGNLESNGNRLNLFFDTNSGTGQRQLTATNADVDNNGLNRHAGLSFDAGFTADYFLTLNITNPTALEAAASFAPIDGAGGTGTLLASGPGLSKSLTFSGTLTGELAIDNDNAAGVSGTAVGNPGAVTSGIEYAIPLAALGSPTGPIRVSAFVTSGDHSFISNQVLAGLPDGSGNLGNPTNANFGSFVGNQFFTVANGMVAPVVITSASALAFGTTTVGSPTTRRLVVRNVGNAALTVTGITSDNAVFSASPVSGSVAVGDSLVVTVTFDPTAAGAQAGTLTIASNDPGQPTLTISLTGTGVAAPTAVLSTSAATLSLGSVTVGSTGTGTFYVRNRGNAALSLTGITSSDPQFTAAPGTGTVAPGDSLLVTVTFAPTAAGSATGTLTLASNGGTATVALTGTGLAAGTFVVDGTRDTGYGAALAVQTSSTGFGNTTTGQQTVALLGSELDAAYARIENNTLYLLLTGNLESNGNKLELFFDTQTGGQNQLLNTNADVDGNGLNRMAGLTFDAGFAPEYYLTFNNTNPAAGFTTAAYFAPVDGAGGTGVTLANGLGRTQALTFSGTLTGQISLDNSNVAGVDGSTVGAPDAVTTGVELAIPLAALGNPTGPIRISTFINGGSHDFLSNQVLAGVPAGTANLGDPLNVNFNTPAGNQFFVVANGAAAPSVSLSTNSVAVGNVTVGGTGTGTFFVRNRGAAPLTLTGITSSGAPFTVAPGTGTIAPGDSLLVTVTFAPTATGAQTATLTLATNDPAQPSITVAVSGTGVAAPAGILTVSTTALNLGSVAVGGTSTGTFTIRNTGNAPLTISGLASTNGVFTAAPGTGTIAAGDSLVVTVTFAPTAGGAQTGTLTVTANTGTAAIALSGNGVVGLPAELTAAVSLAPNPTAGRTTLRLPTALLLKGATVEVFDALGRRVRTVAIGRATAGAELALDLNLSGLPMATYAVRVQTPDGALVRRLVLTAE